VDFPIALSALQPLALDPQAESLTREEHDTLAANIQLCRDTIVFFTATGAARGVGGHTGGHYDCVPEALILEAFFQGDSDRFLPILFDEAGHRVASHYLLSVLRGDLPAEAVSWLRGVQQVRDDVETAHFADSCMP
jgi:hypothetical protein